MKKNLFQKKMATSKWINRLYKELETVNGDTEFVQQVKTEEDNIRKWEISYNDAVLPSYLKHLTVYVEFPANYPFQPPKIRIPAVFNPNVYPNGSLCMSLLDDSTNRLPGALSSIYECWRPCLSIASVLRGILLVLEHPNTDSPANLDATKMYKKYECLYCI